MKLKKSKKGYGYVIPQKIRIKFGIKQKYYSFSNLTSKDMDLIGTKYKAVIIRGSGDMKKGRVLTTGGKKKSIEKYVREGNIRSKRLGLKYVIGLR